mmetsp:Transcript_8240/g.16689  ORF Transcript_8240/g.16689 Transcript_8240/m.16689 type:complete len:89 (-) Transcript_8240:2746-3012(-)
MTALHLKAHLVTPVLPLEMMYFVTMNPEAAGNSRSRTLSLRADLILPYFTALWPIFPPTPTLSRSADRPDRHSFTQQGCFCLRGAMHL